MRKPIDQDSKDQINNFLQAFSLLHHDIREEIAEVKEQNKLYTTENEQLLTENVELKKKNKEMEEHIKGEPTLIFTATKTDYYAIRLEENQQLYLN